MLLDVKIENAKKDDFPINGIKSSKPPFEVKCRCLWSLAIERTDWTNEIHQCCLCTAHFISGKCFSTVYHTQR